MRSTELFAAIMAMFLSQTLAFAPLVPPPSSFRTTSTVGSSSSASRTAANGPLFMAQGAVDKKTSRKKSVGVKDTPQENPEESKKKEEQWRVVLHNDEVHTFNYVIRSLSKVIGTLDRKASFEICVQTHGIGKATITKTWKKQAEQYCLGLQRQGLTVSISPDQDFDGGHSGGGL